MKALIIRRPPKVSSNWDMMSPHCPWATTDWLFNLRLTDPITQPAKGRMTSTNNVSCQLTVNSVIKQTTKAIGLRINISSELVSEFSTTDTSALILAMISPLRSSEKKLNGNLNTLLYTSIRISRTIPVRRGTITAAEAKYPVAFSNVITIRISPMNINVTKAPFCSII